MVGVDINLSGLKREDLLRVVLLLEQERYNSDKMGRKKVNFSNRELSVLVYLYIINGISSAEEMVNFIETCYSLGFTKVISPQSIRNVLTKAREIGWVKRPSSNTWKVIVIPDSLEEVFYIRALMTNYVINN